MKHTPGPWEYEEAEQPWRDNHVWSKGGRQKGKHIANVVYGHDVRLIAAAPQLLGLVQFFVDNFEEPRCLENRDIHYEAVKLLNDLKGGMK